MVRGAVLHCFKAIQYQRNKRKRHVSVKEDAADYTKQAQPCVGANHDQRFGFSEGEIGLTTHKIIKSLTQGQSQRTLSGDAANDGHT